jgi:hypothetical protein
MQGMLRKTDPSCLVEVSAIHPQQLLKGPFIQGNVRRLAGTAMVANNTALAQGEKKMIPLYLANI